jgi:hypothetical protein
MTRHHHVAAVDDTRAHKGGPGALVSSRDIEAWCVSQSPTIDYGADEPRRNAFFEDADKEEAATDHRLLKFKEAVKRNARNYWARATHAKAARQEARARGYVEVPWDPYKKRWDWQNAFVP